MAEHSFIWQYNIIFLFIDYHLKSTYHQLTKINKMLEFVLKKNFLVANNFLSLYIVADNLRIGNHIQVK